MSLTDISQSEGLTHIKAFFEYVSMGILVSDSSGKIIAVNPFVLKEFGYTEEELIGKTIETLIPSRFSNKHIDHLEKYFIKPQTRSIGEGMDLVALKKDGTEFPVEISLSNYYNNGDKFVIAFMSNISVLKKTEAEIEKLKGELEAIVEQRTSDLRETLHQLEISRDKLKNVLSFQKALLDNAGAMIIATDENGIIKLFNPEASLNTGYHESEVINKNTPLLFHDKKDITRKRKQLFDEFGITIKDDFAVLVEKSRRNTHEEEQYRYIRKDGSFFPISLTVTAIRDYAGEITGFVGIAIDISARKKAEKELLETLEKEKELSELKTRFVSMASHEFRTPLSTVLSSAYLIEKYATADDQPKREKHLQRIISSVNMLTDILNDFLSVGKIEEGIILVRPTRFNIHDLIIIIIGEIKNSIKKQQQISYHHEGNPDVIMDASLLRHIIMNLVSNASKFSPEESLIEINTISHIDQITLSVRDRGMGISKEDQKHLMERFFRGANAAYIQGTGLGLHIVSKYAELMNGKIKCISELEKGTEFIITFNIKIELYEKDFTD